MWKWKSLSCPTLCDPMDYTVHGILQARILEWVAFPFSRGSSQPRDRTRFSALQVNSLPTEPQGKPKHIGVGSLSLLQWIFLTQKSNWGLLRCRQILHQLSSQWSLKVKVALCNPMDYTVHGILQVRIPEWVAFPSPGASSQPRGRTQVSHVAGGFLTSWATREALKDVKNS